MNKIFLSLICVFSLCGFKIFHTQQDRLAEANQAYNNSQHGREFYICGQEQSLLPGKKIFKTANCVITPPRVSPHVKCVLYFYNALGQIEQFETILTYDYLNTSDFHQAFNEMNSRFNSFPFCSANQYQQYLVNIEEEKIRIEQEKMQQMQAQQARLKYEQDCAQAKEKASLRKQEIIDILKTEKIAKFTNFKVVDFPDNGVIIANDCRDSYYDCEEQRYLIYTDDTDYATNEIFNDKKLLYVRVGNYKYKTVMGSIHSIPAYKATEYAIREIDYRTYLNDESIKNCY